MNLSTAEGQLLFRWRYGETSFFELGQLVLFQGPIVMVTDCCCTKRGKLEYKKSQAPPWCLYGDPL